MRPELPPDHNRRRACLSRNHFRQVPKLTKREPAVMVRAPKALPAVSIGRGGGAGWARRSGSGRRICGARLARNYGRIPTCGIGLTLHGGAICGAAGRIARRYGSVGRQALKLIHAHAEVRTEGVWRVIAAPLCLSDAWCDE